MFIYFTLIVHLISIFLILNSTLPHLPASHKHRILNSVFSLLVILNRFAFVSVIQSRKWMFSVYISHNFFVSSKIINMFLLVKSLNQCWFLMLFSYVVLAQTSVMTFRLQFVFSHCSSFSRPIYHVPPFLWCQMQLCRSWNNFYYNFSTTFLSDLQQIIYLSWMDSYIAWYNLYDIYSSLGSIICSNLTWLIALIALWRLHHFLFPSKYVVPDWRSLGLYRVV